MAIYLFSCEHLQINRIIANAGIYRVHGIREPNAATPRSPTEHFPETPNRHPAVHLPAAEVQAAAGFPFSASPAAR